MAKHQKLTFTDIKELTTSYLSGESKASLAKRFNISPQTIESYIDLSPKTRTDIEKKVLAQRIIKENDELYVIKKRLRTAVEETLEEFSNSNEKLKYIDKLEGIIEKYDRHFRLNNDLATENIATKETKRTFDLAKTLEAIKTPEDQKRFLRSQLLIKSEED